MKLLGLALLYIGIFAPGLAVAGEAAKSFPGIETLMSPQEFKAAGLDKLSAAEREALNSFLIRYTAEDAPVLLTTNEEVREASKDIDIRSRVKGDFRGWSGETVFQLENGQIWRQRLSGRYSHAGSPNPEVRITRNFMGFYMLTVVETGKKVGVKLVR